MNRASRMIVAAVVCLACVAGVAAGLDDIRFERMWPTLQQPWYFSGPDHIAVDLYGNVYVSDEGNYTVQKFTPSGQLISKQITPLASSWLITNSSPPLATDEEGYLYLADPNNDRILRYSPQGALVHEWGESGDGDGELRVPSGIVVEDGLVYVTEDRNSRVQVFTTDGDFVRKWGSPGSGDGQFNWLFENIHGIDLDENGYVYVTDTGNNRIQKFTKEGVFVLAWGTQGSDPGQFWWPLDIATDGQGHVCVADYFNHRIQKFTTDGTFVAVWLDDSGDSELFVPSNIDVGPTGDVWVANTGGQRVKRLTSEGRLLFSWGPDGTRPGQFRGPVSAATDSAGTLYVVDYGNSRIQKFDPDGQYIASLGGCGADPGQFAGPSSIAIDAQDRLYVADTYNDRIQKLTTDGQFLGAWDGPNDTDDYFPERLALDGLGHVYVLGNSNHLVQVFDTDGTFITEWGDQGVDPGEIEYATGIAADGEGYVYIADGGDGRVKRFTAAGESVDEIWITWPHQLYGVAVGPEGYVHAFNEFYVRQYTKDGDFVQSWGGFGSDPGQFLRPMGIAWGTGDSFYVCDTGNQRVQAFREDALATGGSGAVIVAGRSLANERLWDATRMCSNLAYRALVHQGFNKDSIYYLTSDDTVDLDGNGEADDRDGDATAEGLEEALTTWAAGKHNLVVYLVGPGSRLSFQMGDDERVTAAELADWLSTAAGGITGRLVVLYDASASGSFIPALTTLPGSWTVITSATSSQGAYFVTDGTISFSNLFWGHIFRGQGVAAAFALARKTIGDDGAYQMPQVRVSTKAGLGKQEAEVVEGNVVYDESPAIGAVSPAQNLQAGTTAALYAQDVTDDNVTISRVWAVIRSPAFLKAAATATVVDLPTVELLADDDGRYEGNYDAFALDGTYLVDVYALDDNLNLSEVSQTTVTKSNGFTGCTLTGVVMDADTEQGIANAEVVLSDYYNLSATANENGVYTFALLPPDDYTVEASAPNYQSQTKTVELGEGETKILNFALEPGSGNGQGQGTGCAAVKGLPAGGPTPHARGDMLVAAALLVLLVLLRGRRRQPVR